MPYINPYIEKIKDNKHIIKEKEIAVQNQGRWNSFFGNDFPIYLEIGTGLGNFFSTQVGSNPEKNYIGMELKYKRVYKTYEKTIQNGGENFVIIKRFGQEISEIIGKEELDGTYIFFPDPWDKKDNQKKNKLLQKDFLVTLFEKTKQGGKLIFKTDHRGYFDEVIEIIKDLNLWRIEKYFYDYEKEYEHFDKKNLTEFEGLFRGEQKTICYAEFYKV